MAAASAAPTSRRTNPLDTQPFLFGGSQGVMTEEQGIPGLYFMRARYYSADAGVFLSTDPVKNIGPTWRPNAYVYANGNPLRYSDPEGKGFFEMLVGAVIGAVVNSVVDIVTQEIKHPGKVDWHSVAGAALTGAIEGGLIGLTDGASLGVQIAGGFAIGAVSSAAGKTLELGLNGDLNRANAGKDLEEIGISAAIGGATGAIMGGMGGARSKRLLMRLRTSARPAWTKAFNKGLPALPSKFQEDAEPLLNAYGEAADVRLLGAVQAVSGMWVGSSLIPV